MRNFFRSMSSEDPLIIITTKQADRTAGQNANDDFARKIPVVLEYEYSYYRSSRASFNWLR